ncbi:hypothetical protein NKI94_29905, partial [Mesorhizobium australicum]|uniref:hypothetical protein n=1 Tax=Mesorhizobium australicum TaxID=536018 RepID=UPI003338FCD4
SDAAWLRQLHSYGLLRGSFRPNAQIATLRAYLRQAIAPTARVASGKTLWQRGFPADCIASNG